MGCSQEQEVVIYLHGVWTAKDRTDEVAKQMFENVPEIVDRARLSLESLGYMFPVIGLAGILTQRYHQAAGIIQK